MPKLLVAGLLGVSVTAFGGEKDEAYFAAGPSVGVGYESLSYIRSPDLIQRYNGAVLELATANLRPLRQMPILVSTGEWAFTSRPKPAGISSCVAQPGSIGMG